MVCHVQGRVVKNAPEETANRPQWSRKTVLTMPAVTNQDQPDMDLS